MEKSKIKTLSAFAVAAFALSANFCALIGYVPPVALDKLLHLSVDQITFGAGLAVAFMAPVHDLFGDVLALLQGVFQRNNPAADAAFAKALKDIELLKSIEAKRQQAAQSAAAPGQAGFAGLRFMGALLLASVITCLGVPALQGCTGLAAPQTEAQTLAYTEASITAARQTALALLQSGQISTSTAAKVNTDADQAVAAIKAARSASLAGDLTTAQAQLQLAAQILTAIQAALPKQ